MSIDPQVLVNTVIPSEAYVPVNLTADCAAVAATHTLGTNPGA